MLPLFLVTLFSISLTYSYNLNMDIYGHRGGIGGLVPQHTIASVTIGAQNGATYIEPDLVVSKDGHLIVLHEMNLLFHTNVNSTKFNNRTKTIQEWYRSNPNKSSNIYPNGFDYFFEDVNGIFIQDFTLNELKTLKHVTSNKNSPLDNIFDILTFDEYINLIKNLSKTLNKEFGLIIETKNAAYINEIMNIPFEEKILQTLHNHNYITFSQNTNKYQTTYFKDHQTDKYKPKIIFQSFVADSIIKLNNLTDNSINKIFLLYNPGDIVNNNNIKWIINELRANGIGFSSNMLKNITKIKNELKLDFIMSEYTLKDNVNDYIKSIDNNIDSVFSDDVNTGRVVKDMFDQIKNKNSELNKLDWVKCEIKNDKGKSNSVSKGKGKSNSNRLGFKERFFNGFRKGFGNYFRNKRNNGVNSFRFQE